LIDAAGTVSCTDAVRPASTSGVGLSSTTVPSRSEAEVEEGLSHADSSDREATGVRLRYTVAVPAGIATVVGLVMVPVIWSGDPGARTPDEAGAKTMVELADSVAGATLKAAALCVAPRPGSATAPVAMASAIRDVRSLIGVGRVEVVTSTVLQ
jgi:hypothetical protein